MRILTEGVYDIFHFGHANGIRRAKELGKTLVVGVNSSESAAEHKNVPVMKDIERIKVIESCKWADEVIGYTPYVLDMNFIKQAKCELVVHGDDQITVLSGSDCYDEVKKMEMYKSFERTQYISTTNLIGRMLCRSKSKHVIGSKQKEYYERLRSKFYVQKKRFGRIVYVDGSFDLYHAGHVSIIEAAKKSGDYLIVGLHSDDDIIKERGFAPVMNEKERMLVLYSNKNVDEIVFNAPFYPDMSYIRNLGIVEIFCGINGACYYAGVESPVKVSKYRNDFGYLNSNLICERIISNYDEMQRKIQK